MLKNNFVKILQNGHIEQLQIILSTANGTRLSLDVNLNKFVHLFVFIKMQ